MPLMFVSLSQVIRTTKGDDHIHLLLYLIDPMVVLSSASLPPSSSGYLPSSPAPPLPLLPSPLLPYLQNNDTPPVSASSPSTNTPATTSAPVLHLPAAQIKALKRLATRTNVLPVLTRTDLLTSRQLGVVRDVVRRDLGGVGVDLGEGVLQLGEEDEEALGTGESGRGTPTEMRRADDGRLIYGGREGGREREPKKVIRLRSTRSSPKLRGGRSERPESPVAGDGDGKEHGGGEKKVVLPLALVAPEEEEEGEGLEGGGGRRFVREVSRVGLVAMASRYRVLVVLMMRLDCLGAQLVFLGNAVGA